MVRSTNPRPAEVERIVINNSTTPQDSPLFITPSAAPSYHTAGGIYINSTDYIMRVSNGTSLLPVGGRRTIKNAAATLTAAESGALCVWSTAAGYLYTLPVPSAGLWFDFVVTATITSSAAKVITSAGTEFILGSFLQIPDTAAQIVSQDADGSTHRAWSGNGTTTGGIKGDFFRLTAISATQWLINGIGRATGTEATPFATS